MSRELPSTTSRRSRWRGQFRYRGSRRESALAQLFAFGMRVLLVFIVCLMWLGMGCKRQADVATPSVYPAVSIRILRALGEAPLPSFANEKTNHIYRFTCLRSWHRDEPFCIVLTVASNGVATYSAKMASGKEIDFGTIKAKSEGALSAAQVEQFLNVLDHERFWTLDATDSAEEVGTDGSSWIVEAVRDGKYRIVNRSTPGVETPLGKIGRTLVEVTEWKIEHLY